MTADEDRTDLIGEEDVPNLIDLLLHQSRSTAIMTVIPRLHEEAYMKHA